jgi:hypothetical protein
VKTTEEKHRATVEATRVDRERLAEAKYLMESVGAATADYQVLTVNFSQPRVLVIHWFRL